MRDIVALGLVAVVGVATATAGGGEKRLEVEGGRLNGGGEGGEKMLEVGGGEAFGEAKWIGPNRVTQPDYDMGEAQWIGAAEGEAVFTKTFELSEAPEMAELVFGADEYYEIKINGLSRWGGAYRDVKKTGAFHDSTYAKFFDAAPALRAGTNTIEAKATAAKGKAPSIIISLNVPGKFRLVTDGSWTNAKALGKVREAEAGKRLKLRREVNSPAFEKRFAAERGIRKATLAITGVGLYEAYINGSRVGNKLLDPMPSNYDKRVYYSTYDVTGMLKEGENAIKVLVGHGWYDVRSLATWNWDMAPWRDVPRMIANLEIELADGSRRCVVSDNTWRQVESPVGYDCIREGEVIGARNIRAVDLEKNVVMAEEVEGPKGELTEELVPPTVIKRTLKPVSVVQTGEWWRVDFGENIAGYARMRFADAIKGRVVTFRYDERAEEKRAIDVHFGWTASHDLIPGSVFQCDRYVTRGEAGEVYEPRFTYNGFQYVHIKGLGRAPKVEELEAVVLQTDFKDIGTFRCSDETFNTLMKMADRAYKANFVCGIPTDCPHREKNGWTCDAALASELAQYCYENTVAYEEWTQQIVDSQRESGEISEIVPTAGWGYHNKLDWDAVMAILPWNLYRYRESTKALETIYPCLCANLDRVAIPALTNGICVKVRGDWLTASKYPDKGIVGTCYFKLMCETAAKMTRVLGKAAVEAERYERYAAEARKAFNAEYYKGNGYYGDERGRQTTQAMALEFGMVDESERKAVEAELVRAVEEKDGHLDFGLHGMKWVPRALSKAGRSDLVFKMMTNPTRPSMVDWINRGGTTLWEDWNDGSSRNHIMFGEFVCWAYQYLAGIRLAEGVNGFKKVIVDPQAIPQLDWVEASVETKYGKIVVEWRRDGAGRPVVKVVAPPEIEVERRGIAAQ